MVHTEQANEMTRILAEIPDLAIIVGILALTALFVVWIPRSMFTGLSTEWLLTVVALVTALYTFVVFALGTGRLWVGLGGAAFLATVSIVVAVREYRALSEHIARIVSATKQESSPPNLPGVNFERPTVMYDPATEEE